MKLSKSLTSAVAAAAVVGTIGLAYAQTDTSTPPTTGDSTGQTTMQNQGTGTATPETSAAPATTTDSNTAGFQTERPAQADRN
ncbi:hypothetical protein [Polaromonas aquatica]|uniref:hypothetical protein n=1 Tax=Polaromonas aquatica TaxID=332657 RepID=UPI003D658845